MKAEFDEIAAARRHVNPREAFSGPYSTQPNLKWIGPDDVTASLRDWAARPARVEADEAIHEPTQRKFYDRIFEVANMEMASQSGGFAPTPLRMVLLGTEGTGKTHGIRRIVGKAVEIFASEAIVFVLRTYWGRAE